MVKSPLRYPGGKSRAVKYIKNFLPAFDEYREPMIGGGSLTFYVSQNTKCKTIKASDINNDVYCFWNMLKTGSNDLIEGVQSIYDTSEDGRKLFSELLSRRENKLSDLARAIDFFILNRITFSGVVDAGGYSEASFQNRFTQSSIDRLQKAAPIVSKVDFYHADYSELITQPGRNVLIFLDPPYFSVSKSRLYGKKGKLHSEFNHHKFAETVKNCSHKWLITYDNSEYIRNLFRDYYQVEWELQYGMNNYKQNDAAKGKELLIANYDLNKFL